MTAMPPSPFLSDPAAPSGSVATAAASSPSAPLSDAAAEQFESALSIPSAPTTAAAVATPAAVASSAREKFQRHVANTLTDWRLGCISPQPNGAEVMIFREAMADIIRFRLRIAYMPLFQGLERIQDRVGILASLRAEPYAPPVRH